MAGFRDVRGGRGKPDADTLSHADPLFPERSFQCGPLLWVGWLRLSLPKHTGDLLEPHYCDLRPRLTLFPSPGTCLGL